MQELTEQQMQLMKELQARGKKVRVYTTWPPGTRKCPVIATYPLSPAKYGVQPYTIGYIKRPAKILKSGFVPVKCNRSNRGYTSIPEECLWFTGLDLEVKRWQRATKHKKARRLKVYKPLYEYYQTEEQARRPRTEITEEQFDNRLGAVPPIWLDTAKLDTGYKKKPGNKKNRTILIQLFALGETSGFAHDTSILNVCYTEVYKRWKKGMGWVKAKPQAYFTQDMRVYTPQNKGFRDTLAHQYGTGYIARPHYTHKR